MKKVFEVFVEIIYWIAIFASPFLLSLAIGVGIYFSNEKLLWLSIVIVSIGFLLGIYFAERVRRKVGCARFIARILATPDYWPDEYPKEIDARNKKIEERKKRKKEGKRK
jgi:hypothetical protein